MQELDGSGILITWLQTRCKEGGAVLHLGFTSKAGAAVESTMTSNGRFYHTDLNSEAKRHHQNETLESVETKKIINCLGRAEHCF